MIELSIIVPVYNVEKYVRQCLDSILSSSLMEWECILVDDGSSDSSGDICDEYASRDVRFKVVHKANGGVSSARNAGLQHAIGKWVTFVDSDDFISPTFFENLLRPVSIDSEIDFIQGGCSNYYEGQPLTIEQCYDDTVSADSAYILEHFRGLIVSKMFLSGIIGCGSDKLSLRFDETMKIAEDMEFTLSYLTVANKVAFSSESGYYYRRDNANSLTKTTDSLSFDDHFHYWNEVIGKLRQICSAADIELDALVDRRRIVANSLSTTLRSLYNSGLDKGTRLYHLTHQFYSEDYKLLRYCDSGLYWRLASFLLNMRCFRLYDIIEYLHSKRGLKWLFNSMRMRMKRSAALIRVEFFHLLALIVRPWLGRRHFWVLHERGNDAQDNAWHLLRYLRREHPEVNVRYAIRKSSPDYELNLRDYQDVVVEYDSLRYYLILFNADVLAFTHYQCYIYPHNVASMIRNTVFDVRAKKIFLQHGVTRHKMKAFVYPTLDVSTFICGAATERELMMSEGMDYPPEVARYTGLSRYDGLWDRQEINQILVMPTWHLEYAGISCTEFEKTDFFEYYKAVLTNPLFLEKLEEKGYTVAYYNHYEFQKFNSCFKQLESKNVRLVEFGSVRVQELLKQSKVLMTDFSSVYYDFLYMGKPILFSALDEESYIATQYGRRYDGELSDFGYVPKSVNETVEILLRLIDCDCKNVDPRFASQRDRVFPMRDRHNCERIYQIIKELL